MRVTTICICYREAVGCLEEGGDPNKVSNEGATAMHIAAGIGVESVRLMLAYGGDPNVRYNEDVNVFDFLHFGYADRNDIDCDNEACLLSLVYVVRVALSPYLADVTLV